MHVSIITLATERSIYLHEALASVPRGQVADVEHLVVYDGPPRFARELCERYSHLQVLQGEDTGTAAAARRGIEMASGDFVFFLNTDDRVLPGALNRLSKCAAARPEVLIWTGGTRIFSHTQENREVTIRTIDSSECTELSLEN